MLAFLFKLPPNLMLDGMKFAKYVQSESSLNARRTILKYAEVLKNN